MGLPAAMLQSLTAGALLYIKKNISIYELHRNAVS